MIMTIEDLRKFAPKRDTYFVFGDPIDHSLSPKLHSLFFENCGIDADYYAAHINSDELEEAIEIVRSYAKGVNLTIPHKKAVISLLDNISEEAERIGAVNTLTFENGKICGYNTDFYGLILALRKYNFSLKDKKILILGNGGAAKAFLYASLLSSDDVTVAGRNIEKLSDFCKGTHAKYCKISDLEEKHFDILLNATPVGMSVTAEKSPVEAKIIKNCGFVFDSVYNPLNTNLTVLADIYNIPNLSGLYMLIYQGLKAQELWGNGFEKSDGEKIYEKLKNSFGSTKKNIVLIGYMGSGKTTASKMLKELTEKITVDTDKLIEETENMKISDIFDKFGEAHFRKLEKNIVSKVSKLNGAVISTGGGIIKNEKNIENLKKNGTIFFLNPDISEIKKRISGDKTRPLVKNPESIEKIYFERLPLYEKYADFIINENSTEKSVGEILEITKK